jgi:hypothetical protein
VQTPPMNLSQLVCRRPHCREGTVVQSEYSLLSVIFTKACPCYESGRELVRSTQIKLGTVSSGRKTRVLLDLLFNVSDRVETCRISVRECGDAPVREAVKGESTNFDYEKSQPLAEKKYQVCRPTKDCNSAGWKILRPKSNLGYFYANALAGIVQL